MFCAQRLNTSCSRKTKISYQCNCGCVAYASARIRGIRARIFTGYSSSLCMANSYFQFKQFIIHQDRCAMKVTTDACLFGAWVSARFDKRVERGLDIGAGTGLLSLMLAQSGLAAIDAIEIQEADARQAVENIEASPWAKQVHLLQGDVLTHPFVKKYGLIVANPPFYESDLKGDREEKNIAHHDGGLRLKELLLAVKELLEAAGVFYLLLPAKREAALMEAMRLLSLYPDQVAYVHQTEKHPAFRIMVRGSFRPSDLEPETIYIRRNHEYSPEFVKLLKPYYLHF